MITAGILGLGRWGRLLVGSVQGKSDHIRFAAGATRTPRKSRTFAKESGLELCADYAELLARPDIDVVFIATPHSQHLLLPARCISSTGFTSLFQSREVLKNLL